jgi:peroxiredoxin
VGSAPPAPVRAGVLELVPEGKRVSDQEFEFSPVAKFSLPADGADHALVSPTRVRTRGDRFWTPGRTEGVLVGGRDVPDKELQREVKAIDGTVHTPLATANKKASVLLFMLPDCPICNASIPEINRICTEYEKRGVNLFLVHADPDVTVEEARKHAKEYRLSCPILLDPAHALVKRVGVKIAPEAAVLTPDGKAVYLGRINDLYFDYGKKRAVPQQHDLRNALDAILAGKPVPAPKGKAIGCHIPTLDK